MIGQRPAPFSADDLRRIADQVETVQNQASPEGDLESDDWRWGLTVAIRDEFGAIVGHVRPHGDGWLGFYPLEVTG